ncbi:MAG: hypothetical protein L6Q73_08965 [Aquabacterium sp.]|nr:hypothetical protein [Aquabacterium sp.]
MRPRLADPELSLAMTWIWIGVLLAALGRMASSAGGAVDIRASSHQHR